MSDNSNDVHFSGVRFICSPYLAIKSALASLGPIMARCGPQMNYAPLKMNIIVIIIDLQTCKIVDSAVERTMRMSWLCYQLSFNNQIWCRDSFQEGSNIAFQR